MCPVKFSSSRVRCSILAGKWFVGVIKEVCDEERDIQVKRMHPSGPSKSFQWPQMEDLVYVLYDDVICKIVAPSTRTGRIYTVNNQEEMI